MQRSKRKERGENVTAIRLLTHPLKSLFWNGIYSFTAFESSSERASERATTAATQRLQRINERKGKNRVEREERDSLPCWVECMYNTTFSECGTRASASACRRFPAVGFFSKLIGRLARFPFLSVNELLLQYIARSLARSLAR